jgi:hypothetical protein
MAKTYIDTTDAKRKGEQPNLSLPIMLHSFILCIAATSILTVPVRPIYQGSTFLLFLLLFSFCALLLLASMQDSNHERRRRPRRKLQLLPHNHLFSQGDRKNYTEEAYTQCPQHKLAQR